MLHVPCMFYGCSKKQSRLIVSGSHSPHLRSVWRWLRLSQCPRAGSLSPGTWRRPTMLVYGQSPVPTGLSTDFPKSTHMIQKRLWPFQPPFLPYPEQVGGIIHCSIEQVCPPLPHHHHLLLLLLLSLFSSPHSLQSRFCQSRPRARDTTNRMGHRTGVSNFGRDLTYSPYNPGTCICFGRGPGKFELFWTSVFYRLGAILWDGPCPGRR